ncbi:MAG: ABC transporter substrate-binding protein [Elusimicrobiota bacterium]|nr:MAG: ABC transporter substrate-binding protein [Elusimicrobiota bacterium]
MMRSLLAALLVVGSVPSPAAALLAVKNPGVYTYLTISDADSLDPAYSYDTASHMIILNIYEPLFQFDKASTEKLIPLIATQVPSRENGGISPDGRTYTIQIRKGIKFHDGSEVTPEDVKWSIQRFILQDRAAGPSSLLMEPLLGYASTRGDDTKILPTVWADTQKAVSTQGDKLILRLPKPYAPILTILASWGPVLSKKWAVSKGDWDGTEATWKKYNNPAKETSPFFEKAMGSGPFKLDRWDRKTKEFILARHETYWRGPAKLKNVVIKGVNEFGTRKLMLQAGDADAIYADRPLLTQLQGLEGVKIIDDLPTVEMNPVVFFTYKINSTGNSFLGSGRMDGNGIPADFFADKDVRKAFAYSFDYAGFISDVMRGKGTQATGAIPKSLPGHNPKGKKYTLDKKKAEEHFRKAYGGKLWETGFKFTVAFNTGNLPRQTVCQILKRNIESINPKFKIDVRAVEWPTFLDSYKSSKLPIFVMGWNADYPDPHNFAFPLLHSQGDYPTTQKFKNPEFDRLVEEANGETNIAKRKVIYAKLQDLAHEEVPQLYIIDAVRYRTQREWVKGWFHNPIFPDSPYGSYFYSISKD